MPTTTRIYLINIEGGASPKDSRLVRASNAATALLHVRKELLAVKLASQEELVDLLSRGVKVEESTG